MNSKLDAAVSITLALAAVSIAVVVVRREARPINRRNPQPTVTDTPVYVENWQDLLSEGILMGSRDAPVKILEFADLECPYCRRLDLSLQAVQRRFDQEVALVFLHYPLANHRFAHLAARALECAERESRAEGFMRAVFDQQDSLGLKSWASFALQAGIVDTARFSACVSGLSDFPRVDAAQTLGKTIGVVGTPTVIVNGWQLPLGVDSVDLVRVVAELGAGKTPTWNRR
jgi:protein-disulfide isomerase